VPPKARKIAMIAIAALILAIGCVVGIGSRLHKVQSGESPTVTTQETTP